MPETPSRRWGCVVPSALLGLVITIAGFSMMIDYARGVGVVYVEMLLATLVFGPGLLLFALKVYRDPGF